MMTNLDLECAKLGRQLAEIRADGEPVDEKLFTGALGVLEEQGPYACFLYLKAREGNIGQRVTREAAKFLGSVLKRNDSADEPLQFLQSLASELDKLLFARDLLRLVFVYARYHVKARPRKTEAEA